ncbi:hypothetical protein NHH03_06535 [Stieleria sp. TO1_6]|uniref:hypothetical protein n=1 Tax=Stieleria tagensis TaxID=2956795 RepID=UPI00209B45B6|nr:hypothetical protein [Stieleria tagensis]MCO8121388.1 hypothetical protein [Stieleria tagensis]
MAWIDGIDAEAVRIRRRDTALDALQRTLDDPHSSIGVLHAAHQNAAAFDEPLPPVLHSRYQNVIAELQTRASRKFYLGIAAVVATTLLVVGTLATLQLKRSHNDKVSAVADQLQSLLDSKQMSEAERFIAVVQKQQPAIARDPDVTKMVIRHAEMTKQETDRSDRFAQELQRIVEAETQSLRPAILSELEKNAVTPTEIDQASQQRKRYESHLTDQRRQQTEKLAATLEPLRQQLSETSSIAWQELTAAELDRKIVELDSLVDAFSESQRNYPQAAIALLNDATAQSKRAVAVRMRWSSGRAKAEMATKLSESIFASRSTKALRDKLKAFVETLPNHPAAPDYQRSLDSSQFWDAADAWNQMLSVTTKAYQDSFSPASIETFNQAKSAMDQLVSGPPIPLPSSIEMSVQQVESRRQVLKNIIQHWNNSLFSQVISVTEEDGKGSRHFVYQSYYDKNREAFSFQPNLSYKGRDIETITSADGSVSKTRIKGEFVINLEPSETVQLLQASFQRNEKDFLIDWDGAMLKMLAMVGKRVGLDETVREVITFQLLENLIEGSPAAKNSLQGVANQMVGRKVNWGDWFRPAVPAASTVSWLQAEIYPALGQAYQKRLQPNFGLKRLKELRLVPVGVVMQKNSHSSDVAGLSSSRIRWWRSIDTLPAGTLFVVRRDPEDPLKGEWISVGGLNDGQQRIDAMIDGVSAGQLVFLQPTPLENRVLGNWPTELRHSLLCRSMTRAGCADLTGTGSVTKFGQANDL